MYSYSKFQELIEYFICCRSLQRTLDELRDYQRKHEYWQVQQEKLLSEQANQGIRLDQKTTYEQQKRKESSVNMGECPLHTWLLQQTSFKNSDFLFSCQMGLTLNLCWGCGVEKILKSMLRVWLECDILIVHWHFRGGVSGGGGGWKESTWLFLGEEDSDNKRLRLHWMDSTWSSKSSKFITESQCLVYANDLSIHWLAKDVTKL